MSAGLDGLFWQKCLYASGPSRKGFFFSTVAGFGILGYAIFLLGCLQILSPLIISITLAIIFLFSLAGWWNLRPLLSPPFEPQKKSFWGKICAFF